ncbi:hypothetical protein SAMN04488003_10332 [Loktanella fryxellensis]|uniref:Uncharacterized protein n=1 Tax=Loktanella fryxellensis TaxID=245187 RepID=A0A1H8A886_9RHOB|nr:hypothetical protein SAMN04488003_10332 [Loktanella fryxellensis]
MVASVTALPFCTGDAGHPPPLHAYRHGDAPSKARRAVMRDGGFACDVGPDRQCGTTARAVDVRSGRCPGHRISGRRANPVTVQRLRVADMAAPAMQAAPRQDQGHRSAVPANRLTDCLSVWSTAMLSSSTITLFRQMPATVVSAPGRFRSASPCPASIMPRHRFARASIMRWRSACRSGFGASFTRNGGSGMAAAGSSSRPQSASIRAVGPASGRDDGGPGFHSQSKGPLWPDRQAAARARPVAARSSVGRTAMRGLRMGRPMRSLYSELAQRERTEIVTG